MLRRTVSTCALAALTALGSLSTLAQVGPAAATTTATTGTTTAAPKSAEVSVTHSDRTGNGYGDRPEISGDGTHITFDSDATNISKDPPARFTIRGVFERDLATGVNRLVSINRTGRKAANNWSSFSWPDKNGLLVTFTSDATNLVRTKVKARGVFVRNMSSHRINGVPAHTTVLVSARHDGSPANGPSARSMISPNGRYIAYDSTATNLTRTDPAGQTQEYLYDVKTRRTRIVSTSAAGVAANAQSYRGMVSNKGNLVAFDSTATDLTAANINGQENIYLKNMTSGAVRSISNKYPSGAVESGSRPYITPNGRWVTFNSNAALVASDTNATTDVYVYDTKTGALTLGSPGLNGVPGDGASLRGFTSNNGRYVVFSSFANNLTADDTNGHGDCFSYDRTTGTTTLVSQESPSGPSNGNSFRPVPDGNGHEVVYLSQATDLVQGGSAPAPPPPTAGHGSRPSDDATTSYEVFVADLDPHVAAKLLHVTATRLSHHHIKLRIDLHTDEPVTAKIMLRRHGKVLAHGKPQLLHTIGHHELGLTISKAVHSGHSLVVVSLRDFVGNAAAPHRAVRIPA